MCVLLYIMSTSSKWNTNGQSLSVMLGAALGTHFEVEGSFITGCHRCTQQFKSI